ncbi:PRA1 family protein B6 [Porphyridium purpureum]|uniref:PRA1 family protein n=1 Tax=Porphyridium purpureum TaxID=35688 RepID=A0A5J4YMQ5_PORPP|nr:PRA1 family protein B6 [Porphyridium purpureum]|eukprot:POR6946..scf244_11
MPAPGYAAIGEGSAMEGVYQYGDEGKAAPAAGGYQSMPGNVKDAVSAMMKDVKIYTEPIQPGSEMSLKDRVVVVWESARPWGEFFRPSAMNKPPAGEMGARFSHNVETFFYNYVLLAVLFLVSMFFIHPIATLSLCVCGAFAVYAYVLHPEPIEIGGRVLETPAKHIAMAVLAGIALLFGHMGGLIVSLAVFLMVVVGLHAVFRDHAEEPQV